MPASCGINCPTASCQKFTTSPPKFINNATWAPRMQSSQRSCSDRGIYITTELVRAWVSVFCPKFWKLLKNWYLYSGGFLQVLFIFSFKLKKFTMIYDGTMYDEYIWFEDLWDPHKEDRRGSSLLFYKILSKILIKVNYPHIHFYFHTFFVNFGHWIFFRYLATIRLTYDLGYF